MARWLIACIIFICLLSGCGNNTYKFNTDNGTVQFYGNLIEYAFRTDDSIKTDGKFLVITYTYWDAYENHGMNEVVIIKHTTTRYECGGYGGLLKDIGKSEYMIIDREDIDAAIIPSELKDRIRNIMEW